jgi:hypothetical protein
MSLAELRGNTDQMGEDPAQSDGRFALGGDRSILVASILAVSLAGAPAAMFGRKATR